MLADNVIVAVYLVVVTVIGLCSAGTVKTLRDFSLSSRKYSAFVLLATLSASFIGGGFSSGNAAKAAMHGIGNIVAICGFSLSIILVGWLIVPRIGRFSGVESTGGIMRMVYGKPAQVVTGIFSLLVCAGILGAQVGAMGYMFNVFLGMDTLYGIILGCAIVILYSTCGGMRAVVTTDVVQFALIFIGMPLLLYFCFRATGGVDSALRAVPAANWHIFSHYGTLEMFSLFMTLALGEALVPPYVQRLLMGRDLGVTARATVYSGFLSIPFFVLTGLIGMVGAVYFAGTNADMNAVMQLMIKDVVPLGLRGLIIAAMLSVVMSSADSFLNSASVAVVADIIQPLSRREYSQGSLLNMARLTNFLTGTLAVIVAIRIPNILDILTFAYSFWSPVILIPLAAALLGVNAGAGAFYVSMGSGAVCTLLWSYVLGNPGIDGAVAGVGASLLAFVISLKYQGAKDSDVVIDSEASECA